LITFLGDTDSTAVPYFSGLLLRHRSEERKNREGRLGLYPAQVFDRHRRRQDRQRPRRLQRQGLPVRRGWKVSWMRGQVSIFNDI
jgi:hypothetical protein